MMHHVRALIAFGVTQQWRSGRWLAGAIVFTVLLVAGQLWSREPRSFFAYGVVAGCAISLQFGIAEDRLSRFDRYLTSFVSDRAILVSRFTAATGWLLVFHVLAFAVAVLVWRDAAAAFWSTAYWLLMVWLAVPLALVIELLTDTKLPAALSALLLFIVLFTAFRINPDAIVALFGTGSSPRGLRDIAPLLIFNVSWNLLPLLLAAGIWSLQARTRLGKQA